MEKYVTFLFLDSSTDQKIEAIAKKAIEDENMEIGKDNKLFLIQGIANNTFQGLQEILEKHGMDYRIPTIITINTKTNDVYIYKDNNIEFINEKIKHAIIIHEIKNDYIDKFKPKTIIDRRKKKYYMMKN